MTALAGARTPSILTARTPAVGRFARRWATALAAGNRAAGTVSEIAGELRAPTLRLARAIRDGETGEAPGRDVGAALAALGYRAHDVIGPTVLVVVEGFAADLADVLPEGALAPEKVVALAAVVAEGLGRAARDGALAAQEEMQRAALAAVRAADDDRRVSEARFRALFDQTAVGIGLIGMDGVVLESNGAWAQMMGYEAADMRGLSVAEIVTPGGSAEAFALLGEMLAGRTDHYRLEIVHENLSRQRLDLDLSVSVVRDGSRPDFIVGVAVDITERKRLENRLWHESRHDPLTGLPNRTLFFERLETALATAADGVGSAGVCYIDLDGFKSVNDGLGHDVGDRLLVRVAERLGAAVANGGALLARLGGDEFGVLVTGGPQGSDLVEQAEQVLAALVEPIVVDGRELTVSASVGVVDTATAGTEADALMRAADISLYLAKARGRGRWERHDPQRNARQVTRHTLATEMSAALARGEFVLEYQPLVSLRTGQLRRAEALLRWRHPALGVLHPDRLIGMAEETGLIVGLGRWVLETACRQAEEWHRAFPDAGVGVNVNVAVNQLHDGDLGGHVRATLAETGLPARLLHLELTESAVLGDAHGPLHELSRLAAEGVRLVIDDFGTGYSNLAHLSRLPVSELKIAGSFLESTPAGELASDKIVPAIISLAHSLGLTVTAEGVENAEQADRLRALECDTAQGWYFGRSVSAEEIARRIGEG